MNGTISLDDARLFVAVGRQLSFSSAARRLRMPTSTLSRRVGELENALGARLLQRTSRRVALTAEGERLLARVAPLTDDLWTAVNETADRTPTLAGPLRVTAPVSTGSEWVAPALFEFAALHPAIVLELSLSNATVDLVGEGFDFAVRAGPVRDAEFVARRVRSVSFSLAATQRFVEKELGGRRRLSPAHLKRVPAVVTAQSRSWRLKRRGGSIEEIRPLPRVVVSDPRLAVRAAACGLGAVCAPERLLAEERSLLKIEVAGRSVEPRRLFIVYPSRRLLPVRVRAAMDWLVAGETRQTR